MHGTVQGAIVSGAKQLSVSHVQKCEVLCS